jgi:hypothetical protein
VTQGTHALRIYLYLYEPVEPKQIVFGSVHLIHLVKVTDKLRDFVKTVLNLRAVIFFITGMTLSASE